MIIKIIYDIHIIQQSSYFVVIQACKFVNPKKSVQDCCRLFLRNKHNFLARKITINIVKYAMHVCGRNAHWQVIYKRLHQQLQNSRLCSHVSEQDVTFLQTVPKIKFRIYFCNILSNFTVLFITLLQKKIYLRMLFLQYLHCISLKF